jgi:hypothetical protein
LIDLRFAGKPDNSGPPELALAWSGQRSRAHIQRLRVIVIEHTMMIAQPPARIEDDAQRIGSRHQAGCQLRVVGGNGPCADHYRIAQRTKTMEMKDVFLAGHPAGLTGVRRNESVETLP